MEMQALPWRLRMRHLWKEKKEYRDKSPQENKRNCVKTHNMTFTRPQLINLLLVQGEEKAFLIGHPLDPNK